LVSAPKLSKHLTTSHSLLYSPLVQASLSGHCDVVKCLLSSGAEINLGSEQGPCLLHKLISAPDFSKHLTTSHSFLYDAIYNGECPTSLHTLNKQGHSPLFVTPSKGECDVVKCLLSSGADINVCNEVGHSPLYIASSLVGYIN
jgi:ankyrin repeat protein